MARCFGSVVLLAAFVLAGCSGARPPSNAPEVWRPANAAGLSPALVAPAPMAKTAVLPASAMRAPRRALIDIQPPSWTQLPGSASQAVGAPDGSLWVLSDQPSGSDKYIWHYANGAWSNISGLAAHLAVAPDGTLYAVNAGGGTYAYASGNWTALGGGARALTVALDGSVYVISNAGSGDGAIWRNAGGAWTQQPGSGSALAASWDGTGYTTPSGTVNPGGVYVLNAQGDIYYGNTDGSYVRFPGAASAVAATGAGGVFALGYPADASGETIYYDNLDSPGWTAQPGAGISLSEGAGTLYVVGPSHAIYATPIAPARALPVRGLHVQFDDRGWASGYWNGQTLQTWTTFDPVVNSNVSDEVSLQLDKMKAMGVNTIVYELRAADNEPGGLPFQPPTCYIPAVLGLQYPQPTATELANLKAFMDMLNAKGMQVVLELINTHMEEQPPADNATWLSAIASVVKGHPALHLINFDGDVHVNDFNGTQTCGVPAEAPLWLGYSAPPAQYVQWAIGYAHSLGIPYSQLSAESIVGSYQDENSPSLYSPIAVMKQIFDALGVPDDQRTYALSWYEHNKCRYVPAGGTCTDEPPNEWADETIRYVYSVVGHNGAHVVATEMGDDVPVTPAWSSPQALENLLTLMTRYGADGGAYWQWVNEQSSDDADPTLALPVKWRGVPFAYSAVQPIVQKYYTAP